VASTCDMCGFNDELISHLIFNCNMDTNIADV